VVPVPSPRRLVALASPDAPRRRINPETRIKKSIVAGLRRSHGACWRGNAVGFGRLRAGGAKYTWGLGVGSADVIGCYRGRFVALECKTLTGEQRKKQVEFEAEVREAGGVYALVRSLAEARAVLDALDGRQLALPTAALARDFMPSLPESPPRGKIRGIRPGYDREKHKAPRELALSGGDIGRKRGTVGAVSRKLSGGIAHPTRQRGGWAPLARCVATRG
jgi:hypothetical protein